ncbi:MAG TPA: YggT family protein [Candidatus Saccharimonadales bacterium]|nr:YggT family protein [Candidatus Saccharimonadales bacterium]
MLAQIVVNFIDLFVLVFNLLILIRVLMSWVNPMPTGGFGVLIMELTEPIMAPIRRLLPNTGIFDFTPLAAFLLLQLLAMLAHRVVPG